MLTLWIRVLAVPRPQRKGTASSSFPKASSSSSLVQSVHFETPSSSPSTASDCPPARRPLRNGRQGARRASRARTTSLPKEAQARREEGCVPSGPDDDDSQTTQSSGKPHGRVDKGCRSPSYNLHLFVYLSCACPGSGQAEAVSKARAAGGKGGEWPVEDEDDDEGTGRAGVVAQGESPGCQSGSTGSCAQLCWQVEPTSVWLLRSKGGDDDDMVHVPLRSYEDDLCKIAQGPEHRRLL